MTDAISVFVAAVFALLLLSVAVIDIKAMRIPDILVACILAVAAVSMVLRQEPSLTERLLGMVAVSVPMLVFSLIKPGSFGGGDIKLCAAAGLFLGLERMLTGTMAALIAAGIFAAALMITGKAKENSCFPLGPFLSAGFIFSLFVMHA